jgi:hypothetical protein
MASLTEDDQRCPECGFLACICFDDERDDEGDDFDCHMGPDGQCGAAGSEWCDWECPTMRALHRGDLA